MKQRKDWRMSCDVRKVTEGLEKELWHWWSAGKLGLILQPFRRFTHVTAHSPILPLLHLRHSSFSIPSFASPTSQVFTYVTWRAAHAIRVVFRVGVCLSAYLFVCLFVPPSLKNGWLDFHDPSVASPTSQLILQSSFRFSYVTGFHLRHLASRPCDPNSF